MLYFLFKHKIIYSTTEFSKYELNIHFASVTSPSMAVSTETKKRLLIAHLGNVDHLMSIEEFSILANALVHHQLDFKFYGTFNHDALLIFEKLVHSPNVYLYDRVRLHDAYKIMASADVLLLLGSKTSQRLHRKVFEYMYTNKPIIYLGSRESPTYQLISEYPSSIVVSPDPSSIAKECSQYVNLLNLLISQDHIKFNAQLMNPLDKYDENIVFSEIVSELNSYAHR